MSLLNNEQLNSAVEKVSLRAEYGKLNENIYIDTGQLSKISANHSQIIYGRRGTGKTHLLKAYQSKNNPDIFSVFIDMRRTQDVSITNKRTESNPEQLATKLFQQIINILSDEFQDYLEKSIKSETYDLSGNPDEIISLISELKDLSMGEIHTTQLLEHSNSSTLENSDTNTITTNASFTFSKSPSLTIGSTNSSAENTRENYSLNTRHVSEIRIPVYKIIDRLEKIVELLSFSKVTLLLDEWASLPMDLQPYIAEWLKKTFMASPMYSLKIACIRYQSNFNYNSTSSKIGFEVGGDIFVGVDLDDILVYDKNKLAVTHFFSKLLYSHLPDAHPILINPENNQLRFINSFFSEKRAFEELVKASEGIPRDFLYMFTTAFSKAKEHPDWHSVGVPAIVESAKDFYHRDKLSDTKMEHREIMESLVYEVIRNRKVKAFLVAQKFSSSTTLKELMNARLLHRLHSGYSAKGGDVGDRYDIYAIDYGAYVDLRETKIGKDVQESMFEDDFDNDEAPPAIDKRAVRRIILDGEILKKFDQLLEGSIECHNPRCKLKFSPNQKSYKLKGLCPECFEPVSNSNVEC